MPGDVRTRWSADAIAEIALLHGMGKSAAEIAAILGKTKPTIYYQLVRLPGYRPKYNKTTHLRFAGGPVESIPAPVFRDPCPRCGVRGDIGCAHHAARLHV